MITHAAVKYDALEATVKTKTIHLRFKRKSLSPEHPSVKSPMHDIDQHLVNVCTHLWKMNELLSVSEGLKVANSLE